MYALSVSFVIYLLICWSIYLYISIGSGGDDDEDSYDDDNDDDCAETNTTEKWTSCRSSSIPKIQSASRNRKSNSVFFCTQISDNRANFVYWAKFLTIISDSFDAYSIRFELEQEANKIAYHRVAVAMMMKIWTIQCHLIRGHHRENRMPRLMLLQPLQLTLIHYRQFNQNPQIHNHHQHFDHRMKFRWPKPHDH